MPSIQPLHIELRMNVLRMALAFVGLSVALLVSAQSPAGQGGLHAGLQAGPTMLHSERTLEFGSNDLGNAGFGQAVSIQAHWTGPWEFEFQGARSVLINDDGALRGLQTEIQSASVLVNWSLTRNETQTAQTRFARITKGFQPFIGIGISHVDHVMKRDLEDAAGRPYHLWSDGTLRDLDEAGDHAGNATVLRRDYTYESDVTPTQNSAAGRILAIPAQIGLRLDVSPRVRARMGIGGWLGLSDQVDGTSSGGLLSGDALASGFFGVGIRLGKLGKKPERVSIPAGMTAEDAALLAAMDTDGDGVNNLKDRCPGTPAGAEVDELGCAIDSDGDGYADYRDLEPHSPHHNVDIHGVVRSRDAGSTLDRDTIRGQVISDWANLAGYTAHVEAPEDGWTLAEQQALLAFRHVEERDEAIAVGMGHDPLKAGQSVHALASSGIVTADVVAPETALIPAVEDHPEATPAHFRVQLGAFRTPDRHELDALFEGIDVVRMAGADGLTRVVSTSFNDRSDAIAFKLAMVQRGFSGAFLTAYGADTPEPEIRQQAEQGRQFDASKLSFRIQLGALKEKVSTEALDAFLAVGQVEHRAAPGWHRYIQGQYATVEDAQAALPAIREAGFPDAFIVGEAGDRIVPVAEALILLQQD